MKTDQAVRTKADRRRGIQLGERDIRMLSALETWGVLGIGQTIGLGLIETLGEAGKVERFFNTVDRNDYMLWVAKRIHALEVAGYLKGHSFLRQPKAYTLTYKGQSVVFDEPEGVRSSVRDSVGESVIRHELNVSAVGLIVTQILGLSARREHPQVVKAFRNGRWHFAPTNASDILIDTPRGTMAVEVELTQKSKRRYDDIFGAYRSRMPNNGAVLYLTGWPHGAEIILRNARDQRAPFIYSCALDEFRRTAGRCVFEGAVADRTIILPSA